MESRQIIIAFVQANAFKKASTTISTRIMLDVWSKENPHLVFGLGRPIEQPQKRMPSVCAMRHQGLENKLLKDDLVFDLRFSLPIELTSRTFDDVFSPSSSSSVL